jgi:hypothetical protein
MLIGDVTIGFSVGGCVLDCLSTVPVIAYSFRLMRAAYKGSCINVRRSSDNSAIDVGFRSGVLNITALLAFVGTGDGFVTKWYNQGSAGSAGDLSQTTAANQPPIIKSGVLLTSSGVPALKFGGAGSTVTYQLKNASYAVFGAGAQTINVVESIIGSAGFPAIITNNGGSALGFAAGGSGNPAPIYLVKSGANAAFAGSSQAWGTPAILTLQSGAGISGGTFSGNLFIDGSAISTQSLSSLATAGTGFNVSSVTAATAGYYMNEIVIDFSVLSTSDRKTLEQSQEKFYGIPGI